MINNNKTMYGLYGDSNSEGGSWYNDNVAPLRPRRLDSKSRKQPL